MKKRIVRDFLILFVVILAVLIYFIYNPVVDSVTVKKNIKINTESLKDKLIKELNFIKVRDGKSPLLKALTELENLVQDSSIKYELYYSNSEVVNAYALPSNMIVINKGLIGKTDSPEELIGVLAHELGHLTNNHISEKMITSLSIVVLFPNNSTPSEIAKVLAENSFSRDMEVEADNYAINKMKHIGVSPYYMTALFKKLYISTNQIPEFLNTHPGMDKRISKFSKYKDNTNTIKFNFDWESIKSNL